MHRNFGDARQSALEVLDGAPDLCDRQEQVRELGQHVSVYCVLVDALDILRTALEDERFDSITAREDESGECLHEADERRLLYPYWTVLLHAEQICDDIDNLTAVAGVERVRPDPWLPIFVNHFVKHRAQRARSDRSVAGLHWVDHHLTVKYADFAERSPSTGIVGNDLWVPSLNSVMCVVRTQVERFDKLLDAPGARAALEGPFTMTW